VWGIISPLNVIGSTDEASIATNVNVDECALTAYPTLAWTYRKHATTLLDDLSIIIIARFKINYLMYVHK
jgi:hypothetical protein